MTAVRIAGRFADAVETTVDVLGGPGSWIGRRLPAVALDGDAGLRLSDALRRLGAAVDGASSLSAGESRVVREVELAAWQQTILTTVARATNLGFAQAAVHVHGAGPLGVGVARRLAGMGARVTLSSADPVDLVAAAHEGFRVTTERFVDQHAVFLIATGESGPFAPARLDGDGDTLVVVDAAPPGAPTAVDFTAAGEDLRPGMIPVVTGGRAAAVLRVDDLRDDAADTTSADIRAAFALLLLEYEDADDADRALSRIVLA